jgi:hypothetical protein
VIVVVLRSVSVVLCCVVLCCSSNMDVRFLQVVILVIGQVQKVLCVSFVCMHRCTVCACASASACAYTHTHTHTHIHMFIHRLTHIVNSTGSFTLQLLDRL